LEAHFLRVEEEARGIRVIRGASVYLAVIPVIAPLYLDMVTVGLLIQVREMGLMEAFRMSVTVILIVFGQIQIMLLREIPPEAVVGGLREVFR
jgi:hypothetical protein